MDDKVPETTQPSVAIVIVTWNGKGFALECLDSLCTAGSRVPTEIIVVDNASGDGTPEAIRERFPSVKLIRNRSNLGFAKANNIGIESTKAQYIALINSDVAVPPGCLEKMSAYMERNSDIGVLGPKMLAPDGRVGSSVMRFPTVWNTLCCALGFHSIFKNSRTLGGFMMRGFGYDRIEDVEVLTGWFWVVRRRALEEVGGLDERFFMYGEDIDWCHRFRNSGWRVVFYPEAEALHYGAASAASAPTRFYVEMHRANLQYFRKYHGRVRSLAYVLTGWVHELVRLVAYGALYVSRPSRRFEAAAKIARSLACMEWLAGIISFS